MMYLTSCCTCLSQFFHICQLRFIELACLFWCDSGNQVVISSITAEVTLKFTACIEVDYLILACSFACTLGRRLFQKLYHRITESVICMSPIPLLHACTFSFAQLHCLLITCYGHSMKLLWYKEGCVLGQHASKLTTL
jgi:hypothetical protein